MKLVSKLVALAVFALALNSAALAQSFDHKVRAEVPFRFYAGNKVLTAGNYTFAFDRNNHTLMILQDNRGAAALLLGSLAEDSSSNQAVLVFRTNGEGIYALEKVQGPDFAVAFNARKSLSRVAENRPIGETETLLAQLLK
jgi:hypothetical protein